MDDRPTYATAVCRECGAAYPLTGQKCWLCGADLPERAALTTAPRSENPFATSAHRTFSLSSLFLVMTLAAVCLGVFAAAPGLGVFLAIVSTPALARTVFVASRRKESGTEMSVGQKILAFTGALGVVAVTFVTASVIAFFTACFAALGGMALNLSQNLAIRLAGFLGGVIALGLIICVLYALWGRKPPRWFARPWESALARSKLARVFLATLVVGSLIRLSSVSRDTMFVDELLFPIVLVGILVGWPFLTALILRRSAAPAPSSSLPTALAALVFLVLLTAAAVLVFLGAWWMGNWLFFPRRFLGWPFAAACAATTDYWLCTRLWPALTHQKD